MMESVVRNRREQERSSGVVHRRMSTHQNLLSRVRVLLRTLLEVNLLARHRLITTPDLTAR
jgi:hypothetical protein